VEELSSQLFVRRRNKADVVCRRTSIAPTGAVITMSEASEKDNAQGPKFTFFVDGREFQTNEKSLTCGQIMDIAGVPRGVGLVQVLEDGSEKACPEDETFTFEGPGRRFKKAPRFKRG
jgi:hypothetical protein